MIAFYLLEGSPGTHYENKGTPGKNHKKIK